MRNRLITLSLSICLVFCSFSLAFAEGGTNIDSKYMSDYSIETQIESDAFNPGEFTVDMALNAVDWLGASDKHTTITLKTGAALVSLSEKLPNLSRFVMAEEIAKASMTGNTFLCSRLPEIEWNGQTGKWRTIIDAPTENIRYALDTFREYLTISDLQIRESGIASYPSFYDNMLYIKAGTSIQYGNTVITFTKDCEIDELYDKYLQEQYYRSTFAENILKIKESTATTEASDNTIKLILAKNSYLQFCEKKFLAKDDITVSIDGADTGEADPLAAVTDALYTAEKTDKTYTDSAGKSSNPHGTAWEDYNDIHPKKVYYIHKCDANAVFDSGFGLVNELLGVLAQKDAKIVVVSDGGEAVESDGRQADPEAEVSAEIKISSSDYVPCAHENTYIEDKLDATVTTIGYTGDVYCADCGELIEEGEAIPKLKATISLSKTTANLQTGKTTTVTVKFANGDSLKSWKSSNTTIVSSEKSGTTGIKLTAKKKVGTATVTVTLASGLTKKITVKVTSTPCSKITIKSGTSVSIKKGKTHQIKAVRSPASCVQKITYKSANKKIATVTSTGKVKGIKKGKTKITVKCGTKTKTIKITVK